jgi:pSer/pThr/pTyr-binding forkhead associated (FHA) protein
MADDGVRRHPLSSSSAIVMWILQTLPDAATPLTLRVGDGAVRTVGRAAPADFLLPGALVSRLHCRLEATGAGLMVVDLDSTNGTYVNNRRVERSALKSGDRLKVGRVELTVDRVEATAPQ